MPITETSIKRPVATSMVFLIIITLGVIGFRFLPVDLLPPIEYPQLTVATEYPNVGPEEIEQIITEPIENALAGVPGVERVRSSSSEGRSRVTLEFAQSIDVDVASNDVRAALDRVRDNIPPEAEPPRIWKFDPNNFPIVIVGANSDMDLAKLTVVLEREVTKRFEQINGVGSIDIWGGINREVKIDIKRDRLIASGLSTAEVQQAIARENTNLPGGNVNSGLQQLYVRTLGEYESIEQIANTVITTIDNKPIRVKDVANVSFGYQDLDRVVSIDKKPMVRFGIRKQTGANTVAVAENIRNEVEKINSERNDLNLFVTTDQSEFIQSSIDNVQNSAMWGALLAVVVLYVFFRNGSSTFIIAVAIPISIIATFALLYFNDLTLNQMSFGGLALGVGLIVDNAIVVLENIIRLREEEGEDLETSALIGTKQVAGAIVASTLTTCVIFLPVVFMQTVSGLLFQELALVVVFALVCSLVVALTLVPMLSSRFLTIKKGAHNKKGAFQRFFTKLETRYSLVLEKTLSHKPAVFGVTAVLVVSSFLLIPIIPVELAPQTDADEIDIDLEMADGTNIAVQNLYLKELEEIVRATLPMEDVEYFTTEVRDGRAEVEIAMVPQSERSQSTSDLAAEIRKNLSGKVPGADIRVDAQSGLWILRRVFGGGGGEDVQFELRGYDIEKAYELAQDIKLRVEKLPGIVEVRAGRSEGTPEERILFDRDKIADLGLSVRDVAQVVQTNIGGSRAGSYRVGGDEYPITVRLQPEDRLGTLDIDNISIRTPDGGVLPVSSVIKKQRGRGPEDINRINGQRVTNITANLQSGVALSEAVEAIKAELIDYPLPDGFNIVYGGEYEEQQKAANDFSMAVIMALILIYMVMAGQFERFFDPLVVMFSVPLAMIGVIPALLLTGTTINIQSLMGMIMLIGIVVNNAIVLVDYINLMRREKNMPVLEAVIEAGRLRLRPILMTTLTTVLGLLPLSFGLGAGAEIQASLARVVIGGLTASTLVTLVFIPVVYVSTAKFLEKAKAISWNPFGTSNEVELAK
ncbi:MAG: efflux RND transporter permease subunit [Gracilimonas sp.]|uniref:efflux RND transporter permease subunit n=1 Tax=Gracilimonas sp. TaxID=1974203 RepID=UPI001B149130|nr:efflux RND transporter permease subunit [Gracilimonas sp.]MBO6585946.1 efflux RND transporter permease subunit [Gracilimonas sp.]MBO6616943.1 efflux RND transporter permease subunit [Gracilimonas sp.]